jgi:CheY-like chemotaxis protein
VNTILIIEDNNDIRENLCEMLELKGYGVLVAVNGKIGLDLAKEKKPDIILCDILMPQMDGYNVFTGLKDNPDTMDIPFIFITGSAEKKEIEMGLSIGADGYISKPFDETELFESIERCLSAKKISSMKTKSELNADIQNSPPR